MHFAKTRPISNQFSNKKGAIAKPERPKKHPIWAAHPRTHLSTKYPPGVEMVLTWPVESSANSDANHAEFVVHHIFPLANPPHSACRYLMSSFNKFKVRWVLPSLNRIIKVYLVCSSCTYMQRLNIKQNIKRVNGTIFVERINLNERRTFYWKSTLPIFRYICGYSDSLLFLFLCFLDIRFKAWSKNRRNEIGFKMIILIITLHLNLG